MQPLIKTPQRTLCPSLTLKDDDKRSKIKLCSDINKTYLLKKMSKIGFNHGKNEYSFAEFIYDLQKNGKPIELLVNVEEKWEEEKYYCVLYEYVGELDLFKHVKNAHWGNHPISVDNWIPIASLFAKKLCQVISELHDNNIFHGDISLENIIYNEKTNRFALIDFESCHKGNAIVDRKDLISPCWKLHYAPKEVYDNSSKLDMEKIDIYEVAMSIIIMLTGVYPYEKPNNDDPLFMCLIQHGIKKWCEMRNKLIESHRPVGLHMFPDSLPDLLEQMLGIKGPSLRMKDILSHPFMSAIKDTPKLSSLVNKQKNNILVSYDHILKTESTSNWSCHSQSQSQKNYSDYEDEIYNLSDGEFDYDNYDCNSYCEENMIIAYENY